MMSSSPETAPETTPAPARSALAATSASRALPALTELVPHRPPMLLLDRLCAHGDDFAVCEVTIRPDSMFLEDHAPGSRPERLVPAVVGLEYMAQCVAAYAGLVARAAGGTPKIGFLIGCRELVLDVDGFRVGDVLEIKATRVWGEISLGSFTGEIRRDGQSIARGTLTVYQGPLDGHTGAPGPAAP